MFAISDVLQGVSGMVSMVRLKKNIQLIFYKSYIMLKRADEERWKGDTGKTITNLVNFPK